MYPSILSAELTVSTQAPEEMNEAKSGNVEGWLSDIFASTLKDEFGPLLEAQHGWDNRGLGGA